MKIAIGIHVHAEPARFTDTIVSLQGNTSLPVALVVLPDGPDRATADHIEAYPDLPRWPTSDPRGPPACFNRLCAWIEADLYVLLESGSRVAGGWLDYLLEALNAAPDHGLAGPSTNTSWNEQGVFPDAGDATADVEALGQKALRRFGRTWQRLDRLHSLADFCYAVRHEVVEAVGAADEAYGLGPCWEMDYNVRAARAGFKGVWAHAAYVHRAPFTPRRVREEAARFESSKQRYQRKFCGLHLSGRRSNFASHCRGEACEHFAPAGLISVAGHRRRGGLAPPVATKLPLVSCVMPTGGRRDFALQSVRYFQRQEYPERELLILDDGQDDLESALPRDPLIRYVRTAPNLTIGEKRNLGSSLARGSVIAQWDDDDWFDPRRLSFQLAPLIAGAADVTALRMDCLLDLARWTFWSCTPDLHRRLFFADVHGGTLAYTRRVWTQLAQYPRASLAEDAAFLRHALRRGARMRSIESEGLFIYVRHTDNAWSFTCGRHIDARGWLRLPEPPLPEADRAFYAERCEDFRIPLPRLTRAQRWKAQTARADGLTSRNR